MARPEAGSLDLVVVLRVVLVVVAAAVTGTRVPIVVGSGGFLEKLLQKFKIRVIKLPLRKYGV